MMRHFIAPIRWSLILACMLFTGLLHAADDGDVGVSSSPLELAPGTQRSGSKGAGGSRILGEFVVHNKTSLNIVYQVQWGSNGEWKEFNLATNRLRRHGYPLDGTGKAPTPRLRFDNQANDKRVTWKPYRMEFGRVSAGGPQGNINQAVHYEFTSQGNSVGLVRR